MSKHKEFHSQYPEPVRVEFSRCRLHSEKAVRLTMYKPDSDDIMAGWFANETLASNEQEHLEKLGYSLARMDVYELTDSVVPTAAPLNI